MNHITITELRSQLEQKRSEPFTDREFDDLLILFNIYAHKRGLYTARAVRKARQRGWMSAQMAHFFKQYVTE